MLIHNDFYQQKNIGIHRIKTNIHLDTFNNRHTFRIQTHSTSKDKNWTRNQKSCATKQRKQQQQQTNSKRRWNMKSNNKPNIKMRTSSIVLVLSPQNGTNQYVESSFIVWNDYHKWIERTGSRTYDWKEIFEERDSLITSSACQCVINFHLFGWRIHLCKNDIYAIMIPLYTSMSGHIANSRFVTNTKKKNKSKKEDKTKQNN